MICSFDVPRPMNHTFSILACEYRVAPYSMRLALSSIGMATGSWIACHLRLGWLCLCISVCQLSSCSIMIGIRGLTMAHKAHCTITRRGFDQRCEHTNQLLVEWATLRHRLCSWVSHWFERNDLQHAAEWTRKQLFSCSQIQPE